MKKVLFVFFLLVAGAIALLAFGGDGVGFKWPSLKSILQWGSKPAPKPGEVSSFGEADPNTNEDARFLRDRTADFLEDIRFKDFEKAASYSSSVDRSKVNMPRLITQLFKFPPESLDILSSEVVSVELDRSGTRGRVKTHSRVKILNFDRFEEPELIFYWHKDPKEYWVMKLESSINH